MQCKPIDWFLLDTNFHRKVSSKQAIKIWIKLKKSTLNMTKFASLKKNPHKNYHREKNLELNDLGFLCYLAKACPDFSGFI